MTNQANQTDITNPNNATSSEKNIVTSPPILDVAMPTSNLMATYLEYWWGIISLNVIHLWRIV